MDKPTRLNGDKGPPRVALLSPDGLEAHALHDLPAGICVVREGEIRYLNAAAAGLLFGDCGRTGHIGRLADLAVEQDRHCVDRALADATVDRDSQGAIHFQVETSAGIRDQLEFRYATTGRPGDRALIGTLNKRDPLPCDEHRLRLTAAVFDNSLEGVIVCDRDLQIQMVNPAFSAITGFEAADVIGRTPGILSSGRHDPAFYREMWEMLELHGHWEGEIWNRRKNGEVFPEYLSITAVCSAAGLAENYVGVFTDISHRKLSDQQIHRLVHYDSLTELPNRDLFRHQLAGRLLRARANNTRIAVMYLDIDRFKNINDSFGHAEGDSLLQVVGERLKKVVREGDRRRPADLVARFGGDEFVVLIDDLRCSEHAALVAAKLLSRIRLPVSVAGYTLHVESSLGIAIYPDDAGSVDDLLRHADMAMYQAKKRGRGQYHFFTPQLRSQARRRMLLQAALHDALDGDQLTVRYQPQFSIHGNMIRCLEALLCWQHPELGVIAPHEFIPLLEESGEIERVGLWVIETAARDCRSWRGCSDEPLRVSVNLSARQMHDGELVTRIAQVLARTGLDTNCLELEITESLAMADVTRTQQLLAELSRLGIRVAIDDFGTGYSSLSYLQHFPLDALKIDRSFVEHCTDNGHDQAIIRATLALARSMDLDVIAEGVENEGQRDFLAAQGVDLLQGFLLSLPLVTQDVGPLITRCNSRRH